MTDLRPGTVSTLSDFSHGRPLRNDAAPTPCWPIYLAATLFLLLRTPFEVLHGLVEGEEGTVYLRYAWDASPLRALFAPHQGYYSLLPNLCGLLAARVLPLEAAGHLDVFAELAVQLLLVHVLIRCERFAGFRAKAIAVAVGLLTAPTIAIVLCTDNAQFFLAVATGVILISDAGSRTAERLSVLAFAGLNGALSCILLPFFVERAWRERTRVRWAQVAILALCTGLQAAVVLRQLRATQHSSITYVAGSLLTQGLLAQFGTRWSAAEVCKAVGSPRIAHLQTAFWWAIRIAAVGYLAAVLLFTARAGRAARLLALAAMLSLLVTLTHAGAVDYDLMCGSGARYFFSFNLFVGLALVVLQFGPETSHDGKRKAAARILVACSLVSGATDVAYALRAPHPPLWAQEVRAWRADPMHRIRIGPGDWPGIRLTPHPEDLALPADIYDSTRPGWQER